MSTVVSHAAALPTHAAVGGASYSSTAVAPTPPLPPLQEQPAPTSAPPAASSNVNRIKFFLSHQVVEGVAHTEGARQQQEMLQQPREALSSFVVNTALPVATLMRDLGSHLRISYPFCLHHASDPNVMLPQDCTLLDAGLVDNCQIALVPRYHTVAKIGEGTYGRVFKVYDKIDRSFCAMKQIKSMFAHEGTPSSSMREISALKELDHPNVVRLREVTAVQGHISLYFDLLSKDLREYMREVDELAARREGFAPHAQRARVGLCAEEVQKFVYQLLQALNHCHNKRVIHRDLKPQNILLDEHNNVKVADFGLARAIEYPMKKLTPETVTLWYRSPELLLGLRNYTPLVDVWSVGAMMGEMSLGRPLFGGDCEVDCLFKIFRLCGTPTNAVWDGVETLPHFRREFPQWAARDVEETFPNLDALSGDLLQCLLTLDPEARVTPEEALRHPAFNDVKYKMLTGCSIAEKLQAQQTQNPSGQYSGAASNPTVTLAP